MRSSPSPSPASGPRDAAVVAWQGWQVAMPPRWNPAKLEGTYQQGLALFADMYQARLGLQWHTPRRRKFDPAKWAEKAMRDEVGQLAAAEAKPLDLGDKIWDVSLLYLDPEPPGRDIWIGYSRTTNRTLKVVHHARRREQILRNVILPHLTDTPADEDQPWAVFELSCRMPADMPLQKQRLNAGDLSLRFAKGKEEITVRQIAVATLALQRKSLDGWIDDQQNAIRRHYRASGAYADVSLTTDDGRDLVGRQRRMRRRRRFFMARWMPRAYITLALHDAQRDRLILLHGTDDALVKQIGSTVGWARA